MAYVLGTILVTVVQIAGEKNCSICHGTYAPDPNMKDTRAQQGFSSCLSTPFCVLCPALSPPLSSLIPKPGMTVDLWPRWQSQGLPATESETKRY